MNAKPNTNGKPSQADLVRASLLLCAPPTTTKSPSIVRYGSIVDA
jgi:hypothetical protein